MQAECNISTNFMYFSNIRKYEKFMKQSVPKRVCFIKKAKYHFWNTDGNYATEKMTHANDIDLWVYQVLGAISKDFQSELRRKYILDPLPV